jgi:hypothetical protein
VRQSVTFVLVLDLLVEYLLSVITLMPAVGQIGCETFLVV